MRRSLAAVSILVAGCDARHRPAPPAVSPAPASARQSASIAPPEASTAPEPTGSAPARPVDRPPAGAEPGVAAELAAAPAWIYRHLEAGAVRADQRLTTYTLRRLGTQALWTEQTQSAPASLRGGVVGAWSPISTKTFVGSVELERTGLRLKLQHGTERVELSCHAGSISVAGATAVRARTPGKGACEGDRGRWQPAGLTKVDALRCGPLPKGSDPDRTDEHVFTPSPGTEFLFVNDDCVIQGGGYRSVAADGSVAPVRAATGGAAQTRER